jgi:hypothetical protein
LTSSTRGLGRKPTLSQNPELASVSM